MSAFLTLFQETLTVFGQPQFWFDNLRFIAIFSISLGFFAFPTLKLLKLASLPVAFLWPVTGFINLLLCLLTWQNLTYFTNWSFAYIFSFSFAFLLLEWLILRLVMIPPTKSSTVSAHLVYAIVLGLFIFFSSRHYDPENHTFFVPGYELNHDALNIVPSVKAILQNQSPHNSLASYAGSLILYFNYPTGGSYLQAFFSQLINQDPFFTYSRVILATFLISLMPLLFVFLKHFNLTPKPTILILILTSIGLNYLTASFLHTAVLASTLIIPLILFSWYLVLKLINQSTDYRFNPVIIILLSTLTAGVFVYIYIPILYLLLFILGLWLTQTSFNRRLILPLILLLFIPFCNPHNLLTTGRYTVRQFSSSDRELNLLKGMQGNLGNFLSPFMVTSTWFSHPIYLVQGMRVSNQWLVAFVVALLLIQKPKFKYLKTVFLLVFPSLVIITLSLVITRSPYQNAKALQFLAVLFPLILYLIYVPKVNKRFSTIGYVLLAMTSILSGFYASSYIGKPLIAYDLDLFHRPFCRDGLTVIGRDEWAKYFLSRCDHVYYYLDRSMSWDRVVAFNRLNQLTFISQPGCEPGSLFLPGNPTFTDPYLLVDRCIRLEDPNYTPLSLTPSYTLYHRQD